MIVVLDASAAVEMALNREYGKPFREILKRAHLVIAPDIFPSEITNAFWKYAMHNELTPEQCEKGIGYCLDLIDDYIETKTLCREVFSESLRTKHPSDDLFYLVLARRNNASLVTQDKKMIQLGNEMNLPSNN